MGFEIKRRTYRLDFTGTDLDGLIIRMSGMTAGELLSLEELQERAQAEEGKEGKNAARELFTFLASKIVEWNLVEDGRPVPVSAAGLMMLEPRDLFQAMDQYKEKVTAVPDPLDQTSSAGSRWEGEPIPMAGPSIPQPNLSTPA